MSNFENSGPFDGGDAVDVAMQEKDELRAERDALSTPAAAWRQAGDPDPHAGNYDCERAKLVMGHLTDDELANGAFLNYDQPLNVQGILAGTLYSPIAWMTAVKDRIRWLSRALEQAKAERDALAAKLAELEGQEPVAWRWRRKGFEIWTITATRPSDNVCFEDQPLYTQPVNAEEGFVTITTTEDGRRVMVSRQDEYHRILKVLWEAKDKPTEPVNARLLDALKRLSFCAQTTGGVAGRDDELCSAIEASAKAIAESVLDKLKPVHTNGSREMTMKDRNFTAGKET